MVFCHVMKAVLEEHRANSLFLELVAVLAAYIKIEDYHKSIAFFRNFFNAGHGC